MWRWLLSLAVAGLGSLVWAQPPDAAWQALAQGRAVLMVRHATAPGFGDPPGYRLDDCSTQRNLNDVGRGEARRWGELLRRQGIERARVFSSRWCRARETAELMGLGPVNALPALDSFVDDRSREAVQTAELRRHLANLEPGPPVVLVAHQVNITALTGGWARSGEGLILALPLAEPPQVLARIPPP
ncbi:histidine phosphatase family protein [Stutzerimonas azotifigens]|uniref:histidine phosphatase family protein n=1 Tax=Stutzerimonas azotifigens TaxID=291995 RepID=UPI0004257783|nr:histidine phosphatase family protein [Stutzerimonas azotifigens]